MKPPTGWVYPVSGVVSELTACETVRAASPKVQPCRNRKFSKTEMRMGDISDVLGTGRIRSARNWRRCRGLGH
jgi:hypothetical protein